MASSLTRFVAIHNRFNLRDLGGLRTAAGEVLATGHLYRGAGLHRLGDEEYEPVRALNLSVVIDLRSKGELERHGAFRATDIAKTVQHIPMFETIPQIKLKGDPVTMLTDLYKTMLAVGGPSIAAIINLLAEERSLPILFYCAAGKDRTGVTAAVILKLLDVSNQEIIDDYAASKEPMEALLRWMETSDLVAHEEMVQLPHGLTAAPSDALRRMLRTLDERYGSAYEYARHIGVAGSAIDRVRRNLLI